MRAILFTAVAAALFASSTAGAAPCKDVHGKFIKCAPMPAKVARCKDIHGKFAKCGVPGARPM